MQKYQLEFILRVQEASAQTLKNSLAEFVEDLQINECQNEQGRGRSFKVNASAEEPTMVFDICAQLGRIMSVKVNEIGG